MGEAAQAPATPPPAPRRRTLRFTALLAGATLLAGLLQTAQATGSQAQSATGSHTAAVTLTRLDPALPAKGGTITIAGTVTNKSKTAITDAHVGVRIGPGGPLTTRSAMDATSARGSFDVLLDGQEINGHTAKVRTVPAGASAAFSLKVPLSAFGLGQTGVYQLGVTLDGQTSAEHWQHVLGIRRTFLPWYDTTQAPQPSQTRISYLWPLTDRPHMAARGDTDSQQSPIFLDDDLAAELKPGGRLWTMVSLAQKLQVTWIVDPDLLASVDAMAKSYRVAGPGGDVTRTTPGTGTAYANQWLDALKRAVSGDQVVALPFGDTDIASVAHQGRNVPGTVSHLKTAESLGAMTVATVLGATTVKTLQGGRITSDVAWPVDGATDPSIVSVARSGGAKDIIARSDSFPDNPLHYTPSAARSLGGGTTAVVADAALSTAFSGDMTNAQSVNLALQDFLAQTLLITMQAPAKQRTLLVAPQRMPTVPQATAMARAITMTDSTPWAAAVPFATAAHTRPDARAGHKVAPASAYPAALRKQELTHRDFVQTWSTQRNLNSFVVILTRKDRVTVPFGNAVLRSMSAEWRGHRRQGDDFRASIRGYLQDLIGAVHIIDKTTTLTLSGHSGTIPVTVKNDLGQPITGLVLRLTSSQTIRLEIRSPEQPISIDGGHTRTLKFRTTASANGPAHLVAGLYNRNGGLYGQSVRFDVNITKVTDLVMLIIAAGLLLLVLAGVRIYRQRKRQAAAESGDGDPGTDGPEDATSGGNDGDDGTSRGTAPGHPGDRAADTGPESPEPSPASEKVDG